MTDFVWCVEVSDKRLHVCLCLQNLGHGWFRLRPEDIESSESAETLETRVGNPK